MVLLGPAHKAYPVKDGPADGVLMLAIASLGLTPTEFRSHTLAVNAVKRTVEYHQRFSWGKDVIAEKFRVTTRAQLQVEETSRRAERKAGTRDTKSSSSAICQPEK